MSLYVFIFIVVPEKFKRAAYFPRGRVFAFGLRIPTGRARSNFWLNFNAHAQSSFIGLYFRLLSLSRCAFRSARARDERPFLQICRAANSFRNVSFSRSSRDVHLLGTRRGIFARLAQRRFAMVGVLFASYPPCRTPDSRVGDPVLFLIRLFFLVQHHIIVVPLSLWYMQSYLFFFNNGVISNGLIHTFMYWSYYQQSVGVSVSWKKYLTVAQIIQFIWGIISFGPWPYICGFSYLSLELPLRTWWTHHLAMFAFISLFSAFLNRRYEGTDTSGRTSAAAKRATVRKDD